jgi:hypothetical protein
MTTPGQQRRMERRLAAILAANIAGYSRLMGADEAGTVRRAPRASNYRRSDNGQPCSSDPEGDHRRPAGVQRISRQ